MKTSSIPTSTFTFKADVASSEGANNVVLAQIYNDLCPVQTPPQKADPRVRQTIDGQPIVIFWDDGSSGTKFMGKYNFNNDKGTEEVFGFLAGDESWEIRQNGTERTGFRSADFSGTDWKNDFEARYPEDNEDTTNLAAFAEWLVSTNAEAATNAALSAPVTYDGVEYTTDSPEYRLAKFKMELADHGNVDALVFYYVITETFLCIDQREKNAFPTLWKNDPHWMMLFYDADSSLGIDNKGNLAFDYYLEDIDYTEAGDPVFNGQASVLWVNLRKCFYDKILDEYKRLRTTIRSDGSGKPLLSYDVVNDLFESHQGKWSEAIYNEDGYHKSIEPYVLNGDTLYLPMLQGKKEQQRKWWLYNRFRYLDSKYNTGSSMETRITMRAHAQGNIKLKSYVNMYGHVYYNAEMAEHRMYRGQEYEFVWAATGAEDAVIGINDADMLTSLGDLSPLMIELIDISKATHLTALKVGDAASDYVNRNLNSITLGNNILMRTLDLRNCVNLTQSVDASGCTNIEEVYCDGTAVTGVSLPNGGNLRVLHLPATVTNLTLRNQSKLTEFVMPSYANVSTLWLENNSSVVDPLAILNVIPANSRVRIVGFNAEMTTDEFAAFIDMLDTMRGMDENGNNTDLVQISGQIYCAEPHMNAMNKAAKYVGLTITYDTIISTSLQLIEGTLSGHYENSRVTHVGARGLANQPALTSIDLPEVTDTDGYAFGGNTTLENIHLPKLTRVADGAFADTALIKLVLPSATKNAAGVYQPPFPSSLEILDFSLTVTNMGWGAHYNNLTKLKALILRDTSSVTSLRQAFNSGCSIVTGTGYIYVPSALVDGYKAATNWSTYADQFRALEDYTVDGTTTGELDETKI